MAGVEVLESQWLPWVAKYFFCNFVSVFYLLSSWTKEL